MTATPYESTPPDTHLVKRHLVDSVASSLDRFVAIRRGSVAGRMAVACGVSVGVVHSVPVDVPIRADSRGSQPDHGK